MATLFATFKKGDRDSIVLSWIDGKVSFPERGWFPKAGETYEVEIVGQSKSGKVNFVRCVGGPYYAVEATQRRYGAFNATMLGEPYAEFNSGFAGGHTYTTAVWKVSPAEATSRLSVLRRLDEWADSKEVRCNCGGIYGTNWYQAEYPVHTAIVSGLKAGLDEDSIKKFVVALMGNIRDPQIAKAMSERLNALGIYAGNYKIPRSWVGDYPYDPAQIVESL